MVSVFPLHVVTRLRQPEGCKSRHHGNSNRARFMIILKQFASTNYVASVKEVNRLEPVIIGFIPTGKIVTVFMV